MPRKKVPQALTPKQMQAHVQTILDDDAVEPIKFHHGLKLAALTPYDRNPRLNDEAVDVVVRSIQTSGPVSPIITDEKLRICCGHTRYKAAQVLGLEYFPVLVCRFKDEATFIAYNIKDNQTASIAEWDYPELGALIKELDDFDYPTEALGFSATELDEIYESLAEDGGGGGRGEESHLSLAERFGVPPFSVLDTRQGYWQDRKRQWLSLGIRSDIGREGMKTTGSLSGTIPRYYDHKAACEKKLGRTLSHSEFEQEYLSDYLRDGSAIKATDSGGILSIFDPVLCELAYRWFGVPGGAVLDPFAGGSVRGIVAAKLGLKYTGIDLSGEQVEANQQQAAEILAGNTANPPLWIHGDSSKMEELLGELEFDFVFSCPPYGDLEVYSEDPDDLSNMAFEEFRKAYSTIIELSVERLASNRFACFVVGDFRDRRSGFYRNFVSDTIAAFQAAGAKLYNDAILVNTVGSLPIRVGRQFSRKRKLGKTHQNVLVFYKGAAKAIEPIEYDTTAWQSLIPEEYREAA